MFLNQNNVDPRQKYPTSSVALGGSKPEPCRSTAEIPDLQAGSRWF
jgi:hypothetical protein